jgi:uncharacterized membrane protein YbjE (DUF340 family)
LLIGGFIGHKNVLGTKIYAKLDILQTICLMVLLFIMGIRMGMDKKVVSSFGQLGIQAVVISFCTISFSIAFVWIGKRLWLGRKRKEEVKHEC